MFIYLGSNQDDYQNIKLCIITMCNMLVLCLLGEKDWPVHWFLEDVCAQLCNYGCGNCVWCVSVPALVAGGDLPVALRCRLCWLRCNTCGFPLFHRLFFGVFLFHC